MKRLLAFVLLFVLLICICSFQLQSQTRSSNIDVLFSPGGNIRDRIISETDKAKISIEIAMYSFTSKEIANALIRAKDRGVAIRIIMDKKLSQEEKNNQYEFLKGNNINVSKSKGRSKMHNKICIFDSNLVMTGSYNLTDNAEHYNYENAVFISDIAIAQRYHSIFEELWALRSSNKAGN